MPEEKVCSKQHSVTAISTQFQPVCDQTKQHSAKDYVVIKAIPTYKQVAGDSAQRKERVDLVRSLYSCSEQEIVSISLAKRLLANMSRFRVRFANSHAEDFYVKKSYEGKMKEACGMALTNLLLGPTFEYVASNDSKDETIATKALKGKTIKETSRQKVDESAENYGIALELANILGLGDRSDKNIIITDDNKVINIDLGMLFYLRPSFNHSQLGDKAPRSREATYEGRIRGRKLLKRSFIANKPVIEEVVGAFVASEKSRGNSEVERYCSMELMESYLMSENMTDFFCSLAQKKYC